MVKFCFLLALGPIVVQTLQTQKVTLSKSSAKMKATVGVNTKRKVITYP